MVTDGFTGNAVLKSIEGTALNMMMSLLKQSIMNSGTKGKLGALLLKDALRNLKMRWIMPNTEGLSCFGLKAPVIKTHGSDWTRCRGSNHQNKSIPCCRQMWFLNWWLILKKHLSMKSQRNETAIIVMKMQKD